MGLMMPEGLDIELFDIQSIWMSMRMGHIRECRLRKTPEGYTYAFKHEGEWIEIEEKEEDDRFGTLDVRVWKFFKANRALDEVRMEKSQPAQSDVVAVNKMNKHWPRVIQLKRVASPELEIGISVEYAGNPKQELAVIFNACSTEELAEISKHASWITVGRVTESSQADLALLGPRPALKHLTLENWEGSDLSPINGFPNLTHLEFNCCKYIQNLEPVSVLIKLISLELIACNTLTNLNPIGTLAKLSKLRITQMEQALNLAPLKLLYSLEELEVSYCEGITKLELPGNCDTLKMLTLGKNPSLSDYTALERCTQLEFLCLDHSREIPPMNLVKNLTSLKQLRLGADEIELQNPEYAAWVEKQEEECRRALPNCKVEGCVYSYCI